MSAWISVEDIQKPRLYDAVLIATEDFTTVGYYSPTRSGWMDMYGNGSGNAVQLMGATHWMPLPPPPEKDAQRGASASGRTQKVSE